MPKQNLQYERFILVICVKDNRRRSRSEQEKPSNRGACPTLVKEGLDKWEERDSVQAGSLLKGD